MAIRPSFAKTTALGVVGGQWKGETMFSRAQDLARTDLLETQASAPDRITVDRVSDIIGAACRRPARDRKGKAARLQDLVEAKAWTEAALTLVEIELPGWTVRRLVREEGKWLCSLSRQANLPSWLDETVEAQDEALPLAILGALMEARSEAGSAERSSLVPQVRPAAGQIAVCDNFA